MPTEQVSVPRPPRFTTSENFLSITDDLTVSMPSSMRRHIRPEDLLSDIETPRLREVPVLEEDTSIDDGSEEVANRYNAGKARFGLIDPAFEEGIAKVLTFGAEKYGAENWKKAAGTDSHDDFVRGCFDSLRRHLNAIAQGENTDSESGLPHLDHISCNIMFIRYYQQYRELL